MKVTKALKRLIMLPCALAISLLTPLTAFAEETAAITTPGTVAVGEYFTVQVSFSSGENIGSIKAALDYDSDVIEFDSGNFAVGGGGVCNINAWAEYPSPQQNFELTFRAVSKGSSQIVITRCSVYSETGDLLGAPTYIGSVTVSEAAPATQATTPEVTAVPTQTTTEEATTPAETTTTPETAPEQPQSSEVQIEDESIIEEAPVTDAQPESSFPEKEKEDKKDDKGAITAILITVGAVVIVGVVMTTGGSGGKRRRKR